MRIAPFSAAAFHGAGLARRRSARDDRVRDDGGAADVTGPAIGLSSERAIQQTARLMPPKIRELIAELERAGFVNRSGHGSHRNFVHPNVARPVTLAGAGGDDAKHYQVRAVRMAIQEAKR